MKPKKEQVAKLEKNAKVDSKKVIITDKVAENFMRDKIEKKRGRPKKDPYLTKIVRQSKTLIETKREDTKRFLAKDPESMFPLLKSVLGEETFNELMENPSHKEFLSLDEVLTVMAEMAEESAKFTIELLEKRAKGTDLNNPLNQESVNTFYTSFQNKYKAKLKEQWANCFSADEAKENNHVPLNDLTNALAQLKPIEIPKKEERPIEPKIEEALKAETSPSFVVSLPTEQRQSADFTSPTPIADFANVISLRLTNKTDEKLYNVNIFNYDFKEQNQIKYENLVGMAYSEFLRKWNKLESDKFIINKVRLVAICDYKKFEKKQLIAKFSYKSKSVFSTENKITVDPIMWYSPFQQQSNIIDIKKTYRIFSDTEFELEYLMPDTSVEFHFFITKKTKTQNGK